MAENADSEYIAEVPAVQVSGSVDDEVTDELLSMVENWSDIIDRISRIVPLMRSSLVDTLPLSVTRERVLIGCDPGFAEDLANFSQHHNHAIVARVIGDFLKRKMLIEFAEADISNLPAAKRASKKGSKGKKVAPDEAEENQSNVVKNNSKELRDWGKLPAVQETMDTFNGFLMEVRA